MAVMNSPLGHCPGASLNRGLHFGDGTRGFQAHVMARTQTQQHDVVVIVDQSRHHRAAGKVDGPSAWTQLQIARRARQRQTGRSEW